MRTYARTTAAAPLACALLVSGQPCAAAGAEIVFAPHRAVYDLSLDGSSAGSGVADVTGRIVYELTGSACEGYAQSMRFVTQTVTQDGEMRVTDLRNSSWEAVPPRHLRFGSTNYQNGQPAEQTQGSAKRTSDSGPVTVDLVKPDKKRLELKYDIYFPIQHSMAVIRRAREGGRMLAADLFDGSESGDKVYTTSAVIGRQVVPGPQKKFALLKDGDKLEQVPSWPVSISYFTPGGAPGDGVPLYEMSYRFHENGVTSSLRIDHGEFAIRGDLADLVYLEKSECKPAKP